MLASAGSFAQSQAQGICNSTFLKLYIRSNTDYAFGADLNHEKSVVICGTLAVPAAVHMMDLL